jgi:hypothetical protein
LLFCDASDSIRGGGSKKEGKLFNVNYPRSFTNLLGPYNVLNVVGHMWKRMRHFVVANVLKPELL